MKNMTTMMVGIAAVLTIVGCATAPQDAAQTSATISSAGTLAGQVPAGSAAGVAEAAPAAIQTPGLVDILVQQLKVTPAQASGGAGSIFSMAQQGMSPSNFGLVSKAVPGMDQLLAAVPASGATNLMGGAAGALGGGSGIGNMIGLANSFQSLGMGSGMMNQFFPVILEYVQNQGGSTVMSLLQSAILP
jgi:Protein of unknown function VcgC/VcgE (DUF2780)